MNSLEKQKTLVSGENDETTPKNEDFASALSFLTSSFLANNPAANQTSESSEPDEEICNKVSAISSEYSLSPTDFSTNSTEVNKSDLSTPQNLIAGENADETKTSDEFQSLLSLNQSDARQNLQFIQKDEKSPTKKAREFVKNCLESGVAEVVKTSEKTSYVSTIQNNFSTAENPLSPVVDKTTLPQIFKEISGVFKNKETEKSSKTDLANSFFENQFLSENADVVSVKASVNTNESSLNLNQPQAEIPKNKEQIKSDADNLSAVENFDKVLSSKVAKESSSSSLADMRAEKVFEQIEPKVLQLLTLQSHENEKKILKMRLHPAELGTVEIRLEKDAVSGKLNAHFQTESETTKQILTQSLDQLRDSLQNSGWQIEQLEISCNSFSSSNQGNAGENASQRQFDAVGNGLKNQSISDDSSDVAADLKPLQSDRLLSVRA